MTDQERKAMEMALETLEDCAVSIDSEWGDCRSIEEMRETGEYTRATTKAIEALRQALAQPEQKPVAYMTYKGYLYHASDPKVLEHSDPTPLYTAPPSKPWVSLTDEEMEKATRMSVDELLNHIYENGTTTEGVGYRVNRIVKAIEAKLKEKNT